MVLGFSKYTRITISSCSVYCVRNCFNRVAYSNADFGSCTEHGPVITKKRSLLLCKISPIALRLLFIKSSESAPNGNRSNSSLGGSMGSIELIRLFDVVIGIFDWHLVSQF